MRIPASPGRCWMSLGILLASLTTAQAQYSFRVGPAGGGIMGDWGRVLGASAGVSRMVPSRSSGWWSTDFSVERFATRHEYGDRLAALRLVNPSVTPPETTAFANRFDATAMLFGARFEPCRRRFGFRQTPHRLISPFVGWYGGYARLEHDQGNASRGSQGISSTQGFPLAAFAGCFIGWGGPPENALRPDVSSTYTGIEIGLDVSTTAWIGNRTFLAPMAGFPNGLKAPVAPRVLLRISAAYRTAPLRRDG